MEPIPTKQLRFPTTKRNLKRRTKNPFRKPNRNATPIQQKPPRQPEPQSTVEIKRGVSPLGLAALVIGILACVVCWIPFVGLFAIPLAGIGLILAFIGVVMAGMNKKTGFVFPFEFF